ncbi:hypothetical protein GFJ91_21125, partial [Salmonella enterica subsp. enterica serovar Enteritidis]|nr:hypothetical protein [Salmonella enterica subsp. enterica serovar Enteritidis]
DTTHIVVGSVEILYLVFNGTLPWSDFLWPFALPTLAGNICGGTFIFAGVSVAPPDWLNRRHSALLELNQKLAPSLSDRYRPRTSFLPSRFSARTV